MAYKREKLIAHNGNSQTKGGVYSQPLPTIKQVFANKKGGFILDPSEAFDHFPVAKFNRSEIPQNLTAVEVINPILPSFEHVNFPSQISKTKTVSKFTIPFNQDISAHFND